MLSADHMASEQIKINADDIDCNQREREICVKSIRQFQNYEPIKRINIQKMKGENKLVLLSLQSAFIW